MPTKPAILLGVLLTLVVSGFAGAAFAADRAALRVSVLVVAPCASSPSDGPAAAACAVPDEPGPVVLGRRFVRFPSPPVSGGRGG